MFLSTYHQVDKESILTVECLLNIQKVLSLNSCGVRCTILIHRMIVLPIGVALLHCTRQQHGNYWMKKQEGKEVLYTTVNKPMHVHYQVIDMQDPKYMYVCCQSVGSLHIETKSLQEYTFNHIL